MSLCHSIWPKQDGSDRGEEAEENCRRLFESLNGFRQTSVIVRVFSRSEGPNGNHQLRISGPDPGGRAGEDVQVSQG
ncbi:uncharacterized protein V6R79_014356 [Siganus canaliculatus]